MSGKGVSKKRTARESDEEEEPKFADGAAGLTSAGTRSLGLMHIGGGGGGGGAE